jgi:Protein of unknown function (DUF2384)
VINDIRTEKKRDDADLIPDPQVYWPMVAYGREVSSMLMLLRHLYEPQEALRWLASGQSMLANRAPADLLLTPEGRQEVESLLARINDGAFS